MQEHRRWQEAAVQLAFSYPATWGDDVVHTFKGPILEAGFEKCEKHRVHVSLTEPHAVVMHEISLSKAWKRKKYYVVICSKFTNQDVDVRTSLGGGTTVRTSAWDLLASG